jgi:CheY-like chemotaxis protein
MFDTRVLVVDDEHDNANCLALLLHSWGYQTFVAYSGEESLTLAQQHRPDIVLLDLVMPGLNGIELVRRFRQTPETAKSFLVCITGWTQQGAHDALAKAGCDHYMLKPCNINGLRHLLADHTVQE